MCLVGRASVSRVKTYGSWASPITAGQVATAGISLAAPVASGDDVWWQEQRPAEGGRIVVVRRDANGSVDDVVPEGFNARTQVHEYGGGAWCVHGRTLYFSNWADQRIYRVDPDPPNRRPKQEAEPVAITPEPEVERGLRYADGVVTADGRRIVCVRERHREGAEATNEIVAVPTDGSGDVQVLVSGRDFYAFPRLSPDGSRLAWIEWSHPNMPWDGTELFVADFSPTRIGDPEPVAGGPDEAIFQPEWSPAGELHFVSDRSGWWNIYGPGGCVLEMEAEFGVPMWVFGLSTYTFLPDGTIVCSYAERGDWTLGVIEEDRVRRPGGPSKGIRAIDVSKDRGSYLRTFGDRVVTVAAGPTEHSAIVVVDPRTGERTELKRSSSEDIDPRYTSVPEPVSFPSGDRVAHAFYYPPHNDDFEAGGRVPEEERPPLLVLSHGGPTAQVHSTYSASVQFWTSRGFAVVDVNYGGSTGYGRDYRRLLNGSWGVVDLEDCTAAARYLVERGDVDGERLAIRGGSAGGYTTLCALTFTDVFKAGANYFGVADMTTFVGDTHKFESRYLDSLVGPWPEAKDLYHDRSPTNFVEAISCPVITFQGSEDEIVPPSQSEQVVEALRSKGVPCAYVLYEGEQHGFRKAENIEHSLSSELYFYGRVFGFEPADALEPVEIAGL